VRQVEAFSVVSMTGIWPLRPIRKIGLARSADILFSLSGLALTRFQKICYRRPVDVGQDVQQLEDGRQLHE
jgi:hypothetical protein